MNDLILLIRYFLAEILLLPRSVGQLRIVDQPSNFLNYLIV